jgi:LAS superfamily LD-carboxypeptidase LdcB
MDLKIIIRNVIKEAHEKKLLNEEPQSVVPSKYNNINFKDYVVGSSTPSKDKINPSLLSDINFAAGIAGTKASVTTAVTGHKKGTRHESGLAVDVAMFDGKGYSGIESAKANGIYNKIARFVSALERMGYKVNSERGNDKAVLWFGFPNHHHHVHISRKSDTGTSATEKPVEKGKTAEYLTYQLKIGELYNPSNANIGRATELKLKGNDNEKIFGFRRIRDKRVFLFKFKDLDNVKYLEMDWETFQNDGKNIVNGTWGDLTKKGKSGGNVKPSSNKNTNPDNKNKVTNLEDNRLPSEVKSVIEKLKTKYGLNITQNHINKEFEQEGNYRADAGGVNKIAENNINKLIKDCKSKFKGVTGGIVSGYRSYNDQVDNFGSKAKLRGIDDTQASNTLPGFSQHHTGKAFDIFSTDTKWWDDRPEVKKWVANNAKNYGFEITYKTKGTLRIAEPWHLYYVG